MAGLNASDELVAASFAVSSVVAIFGNYTATVADTKADKPNMQSHNDTKRAAIAATAVVSGVSLLGKSPTVFLLGAATVILEAWMRYHANFTVPATQG